MVELYFKFKLIEECIAFIVALIAIALLFWFLSILIKIFKDDYLN